METEQVNKDGTQPHKGFIDFKSIAFSLFIMAGYFKGDPRFSGLPVDLTLLMALLTMGAVVLVVLQKGFKFAKNALPWVVWLYILFAIPVMWSEAGSYSSVKMTRLFTLTFLASFAPMILFQTHEDIRRLLNTLTILGFIVAIDATMPILLGGGAQERLTGFGSNTIALGRAAGLAMLWVGFNVFEKRLPFVLGLVSLGLLVTAMVGSGSRGPFTATVAVIILFGILFYVRTEDTGSSVRFFAFIAALCLTYVIAISLAPEASLSRLLTFFHGQSDTSTEARRALFQLAWQRIPLYPLGMGWGAFSGLTLSTPYAANTYPHNILLEIWLESGWLAGIYFITLLIIALRKSWLAASSNLERRAVIAMMTYYAFNAMVSGDINDNRLFLAFITIALMGTS